MKKPTISEEILLKDGYIKFSDEGSRKEYQKKFTDEKGVKFFINIIHWIFHQEIEPKSWWEFSIQFDTDKGSVEIKTVQWFNEDGIYSGNNHLEAEHYLEKMWIANGRPYYELYNNSLQEENKHDN